jgi:23S rRNA (cytosine1962-C5)-methyltransferase
MQKNQKIILKTGKEAAILRYHPWIFSGAIHKTLGNPQDGDIVEVFSSHDRYLATGHYAPGSIAVKVFSYEQTDAGHDFWKSKLLAAYKLRQQLGVTDSPSTNAYRLVFSEGDGLPGLIIDHYNGTLVFQAHSLGMHRARPLIIQALQEIYGDRFRGVIDKSETTLAASHEATGIMENGIVEILETGHRFLVDINKGQKTGFFLDQRGNRMFAQFYAKGRTVLNTFCYSGAFSVYALKGGAQHVVSVDSSRQAIGWATENIRLNEGPGTEGTHEEIVADIKQFLPQNQEKFDMVILDPPAFAKHHNVTHNALQAYIHINAEAMKKINKDGILFTFSCSQAITREMFRSAVMSAALEAGRNVRILHQLSQGPDHPVSIFHPEGEYLKGLILSVS